MIEEREDSNKLKSKSVVDQEVGMKHKRWNPTRILQTPSSFFTFRRLLGNKIVAIWEEKQNWARWL